ncbi:MAG: hypothetical protein E7407_03745 [Ruminococcaceae bacterium]|nr:hypothetical protein [Oscillospiraceae bacterium]
MHISFENEQGKIDLNSTRWRLKEIEGLGLCEKNETIVTYPGIDGSELISSVTEKRTIIMSGDILLMDKAMSELSKAVRIFNKSGTLKIQSGHKKRKIKCRCSYFHAEKAEKKGHFQPFVIQFTADNPFFEDFEKQKISLFYREDLIKDSFTLPCEFSRRVSRVDIINSGDTDAMPAVYILCEKKGDGEEVRLTNHTTGKSFSLNYTMSTGEEICIDFENRNITSNIKNEANNYGNLLPFMSTDSFLSEFFLDTGVNDVEMFSLGANSKVTAYCIYGEKFIEAVI